VLLGVTKDTVASCLRDGDHTGGRRLAYVQHWYIPLAPTIAVGPADFDGVDVVERSHPCTHFRWQLGIETLTIAPIPPYRERLPLWLHSPLLQEVRDSNRSARVLQGCYKGATRMLQRYYKGVTRVLQGRYKGVTRVLQGCYKGATRVCHGCDKGVTRV
jgi:hypothetical protein